MKIRIALARPEDRAKGRLADATLVFDSGIMDGLTFRGIRVGEKNGREYVLFPSRSYVKQQTNERGYWEYLIPTNSTDGSAIKRLKNEIMSAYKEASRSAGQ